MVRDEDDADEGRWQRQLLAGLGALLAVSLLIGGIVGLIALVAAEVTGIGDSGAQAKPSLYMPPLSTVHGRPKPAGPNVTLTPTPTPSTASPSPSAPTTSKKPKPQNGITLQANPLSVSSGQRINFSGVYHREGATLQVQRLEGGSWVDFPTTATVRGGVFTTYIYTGHSGMNQFRVLDQATGKRSNTVRVQVG
ncbi:MAG: hypothetical protein ACXVXM_17575 [Nocardioidaceae bacterium]